MPRTPPHDEETGGGGGTSSFTSGTSSRYNNENASAYSSNYSTISKNARQAVLKSLLSLYKQKNDWRKYGRLKPLCRENFLISPIKTWWWMTEVFVMITVVVFTYEFFFLNWIVIVPDIIMALLELMAFYKTCLKNPGVAPRPDFTTALRTLIEVSTTYDGETVMRNFHNVRSGSSDRVVFCWRCFHFRSTTTIHCGTCDCCMIQHDHHCPVFGGCVARDNLSSFYTMIISMGCFWLYTLCYCIYHVTTTTEPYVRTGFDDEEVVSPTRISFYLVLAEIGILLVVPTLGNCIFNFVLKCTNPPKEHPHKTYRQLAEEIMKFANDNDFSTVEKLQIQEILKVDETGSNTIRATNDVLNHNHYYSTKAPPVHQPNVKAV